MTTSIDLPPGADSSDDFAFWNGEFRIVSTEDRQIADLVVYATAVQLPDGTIKRDDPDDAPKVWIGYGGVDATGLTSAQAIELAANLVLLASTVREWEADR